MTYKKILLLFLVGLAIYAIVNVTGELLISDRCYFFDDAGVCTESERNILGFVVLASLASFFVCLTALASAVVKTIALIVIRGKKHIDSR